MLDRNLPLFQYALGPKVTSASLLEQFRDPKQNMASIFHENWTLNGVILGYGIQNALHGSRAEYLHTHLTSKSQKLEKDYGFSAIHHNAPSFGFSSINQEFDQLNKESLSTANRESPTPRLPWFSYFQHPESDRLLTDYKKVQSKLKDVLSSQDFLGEIFSRIFSASISVPKTPPFISLIEKELQKENDLSFLLGQALWKSLLDENNGKFPTSMEIGAFIHGMLDVESAMPFMKFDRAHWQEYLETGDLLQARKNLECAEMLLRQLQDTQIVLPGEIHYRVDWPGFGNEFFELDVREIKANFTMTSFSGDLLEAESEKMLQVFDLIPGLPLGMQGMKIGEVRDIYLHPRWARGGETQEPNLGLIVKIKLLWMGNRETLHQKLPLPIPLKSAEYSLEELEHKNRLLAEDLMTYFGQKTWARFILLKPLLSCEKVIRGIQEAQAGRLQPIKEKAIEQLNVMAWLRMESAMHHDFSSL
jgi:hypothetical protein